MAVLKLFLTHEWPTASRERQRKEGVKLMSTTQGKFVWYDLMTSDSKPLSLSIEV